MYIFWCTWYWRSYSLLTETTQDFCLFGLGSERYLSTWLILSTHMSSLTEVNLNLQKPLTHGGSVAEKPYSTPLSSSATWSLEYPFLPSLYTRSHGSNCWRRWLYQLCQLYVNWEFVCWSPATCSAYNSAAKSRLSESRLLTSVGLWI